MMLFDEVTEMQREITKLFEETPGLEKMREQIKFAPINANVINVEDLEDGLDLFKNPVENQE